MERRAGEGARGKHLHCTNQYTRPELFRAAIRPGILPGFFMATGDTEKGEVVCYQKMIVWRNMQREQWYLYMIARYEMVEKYNVIY